MAPITTIKVDLRGELRRFECTVALSFADLATKIRELLGITQDVNLNLSYKDEDGDSVRISSDAEFTLAKKLHADGIITGTTLRLVATSGEAATASPAQAAPRYVHRHVKDGNTKAGAASSCRFKYKARFIKDVTAEDGETFEAGARFTKIWRFRNDSDQTWSRGTYLLYLPRNSDDMGGQRQIVLPDNGEIRPGQEIDVAVDLTAPSKPGRYTAYYRLYDPVQQRRFGQRVWVQILVATHSSSDEIAAPAKGGDAVAAPRPKRVHRKKDASGSSEDEHDGAAKKKRSRKHDTDEAVAKPHVAWGDLMRTLDDLGFKNKKDNIQLIRKHKGNLNAIIVELVDTIAEGDASAAVPAPQ